MYVETKRITVNGCLVSCLYHGGADGITVVFIHGFPFGKEMWRPQLEALPLDMNGIAYDIRGFGESEAGHGFFSIDLFADDLFNLIEEFRLEKVVLCGISMGGYIALRAAERFPDRFSGLILCDTNAAADTNESKLKRFSAIQKLQSGGREEFTETFLKQVLSVKTREEKPDIVLSIKKMINALPVNTLCAAQLAMASRTDTSGILSDIAVPVLIILGKDDPLITAAQAEYFLSEIRKSTFSEISESAHLPNLENPVAFNKVMKEFLLNLQHAGA